MGRVIVSRVGDMLWHTSLLSEVMLANPLRLSLGGYEYGGSDPGGAEMPLIAAILLKLLGFSMVIVYNCATFMSIETNSPQQGRAQQLGLHDQVNVRNNLLDNPVRNSST